MRMLIATRAIKAILFIPACVIFAAMYWVLCPYTHEDPATEDYYNWLNHFDMFL